MKQVEFTEEQKMVWKLMLDLFDIMYRKHLILSEKEKREIAEEIREIYKIPKRIPTLKDYLEDKGCGSHHTFHFTICGIDISVDGLGGFLTKDLCWLYQYVDDFYVVDDKQKDNGGDCTNYHCDHYLTLELKED